LKTRVGVIRRMTGIRKWSFTRQYDLGEGPWPQEDEATVTFDTEGNQVIVSGFFPDGDTSWEGCVRRVSYTHQEDVVHVDVGVVKEANSRFAGDIAQQISYEVEIDFGDGVPERVMLRHIGSNDETQFSKTVTQSGT